MRKLRVYAIFQIVLLLICFVGNATASTNVVKRYAVITAANNGGAERVPLHYAETDALSLAKVLQELGGLESGNRLLLLEPSPDEIVEAIARIQKRIDEDRDKVKRIELFFYYSGHSDEKGLLLGEERLTYSRLKKALTGVTADVQIAVLDSCASGAFTRVKGGKHKPPFMVDESSHVQGYAFLTSSSASENAQESDAVGGAYFTHYLVSALRGAGDTTLDKKVTLNEAYQYAFHETLAKTEHSLNGAQHAAYDFKLAGAGDLVLTELDNAVARIQIEKELSGRLYVRNQAGRLVVELNKSPNILMDVSLAPQTYLITLDRLGVLYKAAFTIKRNQQNILRFGQFHRVDPIKTVSRGDNAVSENTNAQAEESTDNKIERRWQELSEEYQKIPLKISLVPGLSYPLPKDENKKEFVNVDLQLIGSHSDAAKVSIGYLGAMIKGDVVGGQGAAGFSYVGENLYGGQGAGFVAVTRENVEGGQGAGIVSLVGGELKGGAGAGVVAITEGDVKGGQGAGIVSIVSGDLDGGQGAGAIAITRGDLAGGQVAGIANFVSGDVLGFQGAAIFNSAGGDVIGSQVSALTNVASGKITGAQIGALNIAKHAGNLQLGLFNIADRNDGIAFGVINTIGNGRFDIGGGYDESDYENLIIKSGAKFLYNIFSVGTKTTSEGSYTRIKWGLGVNHPIIENFSMDYEATIGARFLEDDGEEGTDCTVCSFFSPVATAGVTVNYELSSMIKLFGGVSINTTERHERDNAKSETYFGKEAGKVWPGASAGILLSL